MPARQRLRVAIAASRFNQEITDGLFEGALRALIEGGVARSAIEVFWAPGAFELPLLADRIAASGRFDAVVCIGAVIRGETYHFEIIANQAARGIAEVSRRRGLPVTLGIVTTHTEAQAEARSQADEDNRGRHAAEAALALLAELKRLRRRRR
ncbi:MAG TPA: 6,7-dimethyl-8-ribityllumazine synthase [Acidobacteriota bacterium]